MIPALKENIYLFSVNRDLLNFAHLVKVTKWGPFLFLESSVPHVRLACQPSPRTLLVTPMPRPTPPSVGNCFLLQRGNRGLHLGTPSNSSHYPFSMHQHLLSAFPPRLDKVPPPCKDQPSYRLGLISHSLLRNLTFSAVPCTFMIHLLKLT